MDYLINFETEEERTAFTENHDYVSYTNETNKVNIHDKKRFFCKLTLNDNSIVEIEGNGELTSAMTSQYSATTVGIEIGKLCTKIGDYAFSNFGSLNSLTIRNGVSMIGKYSFLGCTSLTTLVIPNSVVYIDNQCFSFCTGITELTLGKRVKRIGDGAFRGNESLTKINSLAAKAPTISLSTFTFMPANGTLTVPQDSTGYETWMEVLDNWTIVEQ